MIEFSDETLCKIRQAYYKRGKEVIERVPDSEEVIQFFKTLEKEAGGSLYNQFFVLERDCTVSIRHRVTEPPNHLYLNLQLTNPLPSIFIDLVTITQDFTSRTNIPISKSMKREDFLLDAFGVPRSGRGRWGVCAPDLLLSILPHLSSLQNYLLNRRPSYLHVFRVDPIRSKGNLEQIVYLIEIARRYRPDTYAEEVTAHVPLNRFENMNNYIRRKAKKDEITFWAIQEIVPTNEENDSIRAEYIQSVILSEKTRNDLVITNGVYKLPSDIATMRGGNHISMLRARHTVYMDGRARFPVMCAALHDCSLTNRPINNSTNSVCMEIDDTRIPHSIEPDDDPKFQEKVFKYNIVIRFVVVIIISVTASVLYSIIISFTEHQEIEAIRGNSMTLFFGLLTSLQSLLFIRFFAEGGSFYKPVSGEEIWKQAQAMGTSRALVEAVSHPKCRAYFDGKGLSFVGDEDTFTGSVTIDHTFSLLDVLRAGYVTTFARDGREVLIHGNGRYKQLFRLHSIDAHRRVKMVALENPMNNAIVPDLCLGLEVLDFTRAGWYAHTEFL